MNDCKAIAYQEQIAAKRAVMLPKKKIIIAVDFDGTIVEHKFPAIGRLMPGAKQVLDKWYKEGHDIIIWTCRNISEPFHPEWTDAPISAVKRFLDDNDIKYTAINSDSPNIGFYLQARKIYADVYIDDKNLGGFPGWDVAEFLVEKLVNPNLIRDERYN